jgi:surfactin synthase thioesterase subunit
MRRLDDLAGAVADALQPYLDRPYALFGHSMGGLLAFEVARRLRHAGAPSPLVLMVSGAGPPDRERPRRLLHQLADEALLVELRRLNGTPTEVLDSPELLAIVLPLLRADLEAIETYRYVPGPPLDCRISAFGGLADEVILPEWLLRWQDQTTQAITLYMIAGGHFFVHSMRGLVLSLIRQDLTRAMRDLGLGVVADVPGYGDGGAARECAS